MKIKKVLFLLIFITLGLLLCISNKVNASEKINKIEIEMTELEEGKTIPSYAKVILSNDTSELVYNNIELEWEVYDSEGNASTLNITDDTVFEKNTKYRFGLKEESAEVIESDCENKGYTLTHSMEWYVNGYFLENDMISFDWEFWINGIETQEIIVEIPIVGEPLPNIIKYIFKSSSEVKEFVINCGWLIASNGEKVEIGALAEEGVKYIPNILDSDNENMEEFKSYLSKTDFMTKSYINGEIVDYSSGIPFIIAKKTYKVTFDANGGMYSDSGNALNFENWNNDEYNYDSIIKPKREGYIFKGYYTEKTGGTTLQLLMAEAGIDKDMTFYAQWEEDLNEVPPAEGQVPGEVQPDDNDNNAEDLNTGNTNNDNTNTEDKNTENTNTEDINTGSNNNFTTTENNPQTSDKILFFVCILFIAVIGVTVTTKIVKNYKTK